VSPDARDEQICHITFFMSMAWNDDASGTPEDGKVSFDKLDNAWFIHPPVVCLDDFFRNEPTEHTFDRKQQQTATAGLGHA
jgi:hypothetical protein